MLTRIAGGRIIDPASWQPHETFDGPSFWGHERLSMTPTQREHFRNMRMDLAGRGVRAPVRRVTVSTSSGVRFTLSGA